MPKYGRRSRVPTSIQPAPARTDADLPLGPDELRAPRRKAGLLTTPAPQKRSVCGPNSPHSEAVGVGAEIPLRPRMQDCPTGFALSEALLLDAYASQGDRMAARLGER